MPGRFQRAAGRFTPFGEGETAEVSASTGTTAKTSGFQWTPEVQEGVVALLGVGTKLTQKAIEAKAAKKRRGKKKKKTAAPAPAVVAVQAPPPPAPAGISTQTILLGLGAFALVGGAAWFMTRKKAESESG